MKSKGEKERYKHLISAKKQRKTIEWERLEISSRKSEIPKEYFMQRWAQQRTEIVCFMYLTLFQKNNKDANIITYI